MTNEQSSESTPVKPLRLWPGVALGLLLLAFKFVVPAVIPPTAGTMLAMFGGIACLVLILVWWVFFSRAAWIERLGAVVLMIVALLATWPLLHESIAAAGQGMLFPFLAAPILGAAFVAWAVTCGHLGKRARRLAMVTTILIAAGAWALLRTDGVDNAFASDLAWRWTATAEERLMAEARDESMAPLPAAVVWEAAAEWPGFRGAHRTGHAPGIRIETDWSVSPPTELWRRPIGPGWSSFAVHGDLLYTQEQRGENEVVSCYDAVTGQPVWRHGDAARFWESNAGAGPRATPTLSEDRAYTFGATGVLNALEARDGRVLWSRDVASDTGVEIPIWGFSSSPLVVDDVVIVAAVGKLAAYDVTTGEPRWFGPDGGDGYSSPHLLTLDGVPQVVLMSRAGAVGIAAAEGTVLWEHSWPGGTRIVQPALIADGDLLISRGGTTGIRRIAVAHGPSGWTAEERWTSNRLKPYFSDFVVHEGYAYGFDGNILASIDVETGERAWKGGRYGGGQLVLLPDQDLLLVVSERGELALVQATPGAFAELARFPAVEGKTWNHPVLVDDLLLVRNSQEMVAFRLTLLGV